MAVRPQITLALGVSLCLWLTPGSVRATPDAPAHAAVAEDPRGVVELSVIGSAETFDGVRTTMAPLSFAPATLRWRRGERFDPRELIRENHERSDVLIRCWLDFSDPRRIRLYFADRAAERFLIRELELTGHLDELDREALSQSLELSIRALLEDRKAGLTREEARSLLAPALAAPVPAPKAEHERAPEPRASARPRLSATAFWQLAKHSSELGATHGPGLGVAYEHPLERFRGSLWLNGQYQLEQSYRAARIGLTLSGLAFRTGLELTWPFASGTWFTGVRFGGGLDVTHLTPVHGLVDASAALTPARTQTTTALCGALLVGSELGARLRLTLGLLADVGLTPVHYDLEQAGERTRAVETWPVRPGLALGLSLH